MTAAMAAGVTTRLFDAADLVALLAGLLQMSLYPIADESVEKHIQGIGWSGRSDF
jgi:hypothetical protein